MDREGEVNCEPLRNVVADRLTAPVRRKCGFGQGAVGTDPNKKLACPGLVDKLMKYKFSANVESCDFFIVTSAMFSPYCRR